MVMSRRSKRADEKASDETKKLGASDLALKLDISPIPKRLKALPLSRRSSRLKDVNPSKNFSKPEYDPEKGQMRHHFRESENEKAMVASRRSKRADEKGSNYEKIRQQRIKENNERMKTLGIFNLAHKLQSPTPKTSPTPRRLKSLPLSTSLRRSLRLKSVNAIKFNSSQNQTQIQSHSSLSQEPSNDSGKPVHCPVAETSQKCHQCGKKSREAHTHCSNCKLMRGVFCGGCLKMRYGEDLLEDYGNARWVCPVCRGICSCRYCQKKKD